METTDGPTSRVREPGSLRYEPAHTAFVLFVLFVLFVVNLSARNNGWQPLLRTMRVRS
jgi:hypothetical protein